MSLSSRLRSWLRAGLRRSAVEQSQQQEWQFHIERRAEELEQGGVPQGEAWRMARAEFGSLDARREESRDAIGFRLIDELRVDLAYAVLSLALGIGANSAMFSLMESVLWKSLPVSAPDQLRQLSWVSGPKLAMSSSWGNLGSTETGGRTSGSFSYPAFTALQREGPRFIDLFAFKPIGRLTALIDGAAELVEGELVSGEFYRVLGLRPIAGRAILPSDDRRNADATY